MVDIKAFNGFRYNKDKVEISSCVTPPYDVISDKEQSYYYKKNKYNFIRLILNKKYSGDNEIENKYTRAASIFKNWIQENILEKEKDESIYVYNQEFTLSGGVNLSRKGFISLMKIGENKNSIKPHEQTLSKPKEDRLKLLKETQANLSPIFVTYNSENQQISNKLDSIISSNNALYSFVDNNGIKNSLYKITNKSLIEFFKEKMDGRNVYIADGHHRYETSKMYRDEMKNKSTNWKDNDPSNYVMTMFVDINDKGLISFPIHRGIKNLTMDNSKILNNISEFFNLESLSFNDEFEKKQNIEVLKEKLNESYHKNEIAFGIYNKWNQLYFLKLKNNVKLTNYLNKEEYNIYKALDVMILKKIILEKSLETKREDLLENNNLIFINKEIDNAIQKVDENECKIAFLLKRAKLDQIIKVASINKLLPQKTTYFYPKLLSGLVIYSHN